LKNNKFFQACLNDKMAPYPTAQAVLSAAFASDDPAQGGCPDVPPPSRVPIVW